MKRKDAKKAEKATKKAAGPSRREIEGAWASGALLLGVRAMVLLMILGFGHVVSNSGAFYSEAEKKMNIVVRLLFFLIAQAMATEFFAVLLLQVARKLCGDPPSGSCEATREEMAVNDPTIHWPPIDRLKDELKPFASKPGQPFYLNHVRGQRRSKDALVRLGMNLGSCVIVWFTCVCMDKRSLYSIGLTMDMRFSIDLVLGFGVGITIVCFMFVVELLAGWIHFIQVLEVFDKSESFIACIFWDVVFHLNVSLNEELPVRGWMLHNLADACVAHFNFTPIVAFAVAVLLESAFFVAMHLRSPGGSKLKSMINIFVGGVAGGLNVLVTGGCLGFALGWHFGWNISMGNIFGLSTSGIPISATFISVAPHPGKEAQHGGVFGPEGGLVAPFAYLLGVVMLILMYGVPDGAGGILGGR